MDIDLFTDESARHRVGVGANPDRTPLGDPHPAPVPGVHPPRGEVLQQQSFLGEPRIRPLLLSEDLAKEQLVGCSVGEIAAAAQHQGLIHRLFEPVMTLFGVSVLVGLTSLDGLRCHAIVGHQGAVSLLEQVPIAEVVDRGREPIGAMSLGNPSQFPKGVLEPLAEALETFGETDGAGLPVGVGQNEVIDQVIERLASECDLQIVQGSEVGGANAPGVWI